MVATTLALGLAISLDAHQNRGARLFREFHGRQVADPPGRVPPRIIAEQLMVGRDVSDTGRVSSDGRFIAVQRLRNLAIRELSTGRVRELPTGQRANAEVWAQGATFSPDGRHLAYEWYQGRAAHGAVYVVGTDEGDTSHARVLYDDPNVVSVTPMDWSADGKWLAVRVRHSNQTAQIGVITVADGSFRGLAPVPWSGAGGVRFSPDSRRLAFHQPARPGAPTHDVVIISREGSDRHVALATPDDELMVEWAPDGKHLFVASDRTGSMGLWSVVGDGGSKRPPTLIKSDIGTISSRGLTQGGVLYYVSVHGGTNIFIGTYDPTSRLFVTPPTLVTATWKGAGSQPELSPDAEYLSVLTRRDAASGIDDSSGAIVIQSMKSGRIREVQPALSHFRALRWSPNGRMFIGYGGDLNGRTGIVKIDAQTGTASLAAPQDTCSAFPFWAPDGRSFYCFHLGRKEIVQVNPATGAVLRTFPSVAQAVAVSPDGKYLLAGAGAEQGFNLIPLTDDGSRRFVAVLPPASGTRSPLSPEDGVLNLTSSTAWHPDGKGIVFFGVFGGQRGMWYVNGEGGPAQRIVPDVENVGAWRFNTKSGQVVFGTGPAPRFELWNLRDFLPLQ
jgi:Tol biopolymer transport system component